MLKFLAILATLAFVTANPTPTDKSKSIDELEFIGEYTDIASNLHKRYYIDTTPLSWSAAKKFCEALVMESVAIQSAGEMNYLVDLKNSSSLNYWTSGTQIVDYHWDIRGGLPIYNVNSTNWCTAPKDAICIALHTQLHALECSDLNLPFCQLQITT